jgi:hypothetical protein
MRREYIRTANELQRMLLMLHTRSRAATTIQSAWRGWRQRQVFLPVWRQHLEHKSALVLQRVSHAGAAVARFDLNSCASSSLWMSQWQAALLFAAYASPSGCEFLFEFLCIKQPTDVTMAGCTAVCCKNWVAPRAPKLRGVVLKH